MAANNEEGKQENKTTKSKNMDTVEFIINVKYGDKVLKIGETLEVSPIQANILAKQGIAKKL
ncbi:hypothetical protein CPAST_c24210 [Clostridium pasteurianum DSM 525 = ATCC 6013]|uniref:DUF7210 domain-containing protein n=1 Tax=Clostridium pasteurianum DSM 525 = ATCC 6013 TaxID=1262449 RepID=A0A0H3J3I9_CLOPA|nr:hypothetical protein [Clostridium pasteurianum]AJA48491.1 hypothetical protein CPAST_c24210 [Clostridium pasteurianum DSM 525 = ATCC 6013]AJA52479.1 hypothetical protein CLPA_c24210 [Clostridium pasteurianum DSM 525 = ATCC 6013]AOZ75731.1 hypothetical protein AQ983_11765 [Clostridium pasteurianum DSM 525 = ATCC 6013]AOZ79527.1 hypothetical protein AQ984_11760 [Clostridium pasteurianum]ELP60362.1 hypothetical protein F502_02717 [Clostridium pasteurianum DSM 525 = ATCC 6013]